MLAATIGRLLAELLGVSMSRPEHSFGKQLVVQWRVLSTKPFRTSKTTRGCCSKPWNLVAHASA